MSAILVIDDDQQERNALAEAIREHCRDANVVAFEGAEELAVGDSFETHIGNWFDAVVGDIGLIVCDKELGRYIKLRGLSANPVSAAAALRAIPFCQYSRQPSSGGREVARFDRLRQWSSEQITLDGLDVETWAIQAASLYLGFERIRTQYKALDKANATPAGALAQILGHPECESRMALYGAGNQGLLGEIMEFYDPDGNLADMDALLARMPRVLGNWLFLSIMRFPGILVNQIAAASYLNISCDDFAVRAVQQCFEVARYDGPFHEHMLGPWWWRDALDAMVFGEGHLDGRALAMSRGIQQIRECVDGSTGGRAGYYCMLMREPISAENSRAEISWFPAGADLARIRKDRFDKITALLGIG